MGIFKIGEIWYADYYEGGVRKRKAVGPRKTDAEKVLREKRHEVDAEKFPILKENRRIAFADFAVEYLQKHSKPNKRSYLSDLYLMKRLVSFFGDKQIEEIRPALLAAYRAKRSGEMARNRKRLISPTTINRETALLRNALSKAVEWGDLKFNPLHKIKMSDEEPRERILTDVEKGKLLEAALPPLKEIILIALNTGMRLGEILRFKWNQVNFESREIRVEKTKTLNMRYIPMNRTMTDLFSKLHLQRGGRDFVFVNSNEGEYNGKPLKSIKTSWPSLLKRAGLKGIRFHDLRHTWATESVKNGADIISVMKILGHRNLKTTQRYAHAADEGLRRAVNVAEVKETKQEIVDFPKMKTAGKG